jgi:hypothetical protein
MARIGSSRKNPARFGFDLDMTSSFGELEVHDRVVDHWLWGFWASAKTTWNHTPQKIPTPTTEHTRCGRSMPATVSTCDIPCAVAVGRDAFEASVPTRRWLGLRTTDMCGRLAAIYS